MAQPGTNFSCILCGKIATGYRLRPHARSIHHTYDDDANPEALLGLRIMTLLHRQQKSVYALAKHAGLPVHTVQRICKGKGKQPSVWMIASIARTLGVSLDDLVVLPAHEDTPNAKSPAKRQRPQKAAPIA